jgi:hypothetical protein
MPFLHDVGYDGWLCTFTILQQLKISSARSWAAPVTATGTVQKNQVVWPVHHGQNHSSRATLLQPARRAALLGQPSSLRPCDELGCPCQLTPDSVDVVVIGRSELTLPVYTIHIYSWSTILRSVKSFISHLL